MLEFLYIVCMLIYRSRVIPRYFDIGLFGTLFPSNFIFVVVDACLLFRWKIINSVFCKFGLSFYFLKYNLKASKSFSSISSQFDITLSSYARAVSSAYWNVLDLVLCMSWTYKLKNKGASTEPYGRPLFIFFHPLFFWFKCTIIHLFFRMLLIRSIIFLHRTTLLSLKSNPSRYTVSYAEQRINLLGRRLF